MKRRLRESSGCIPKLTDVEDEDEFEDD